MAAHTGAPAQVRALAKAVSAAFALSGLSDIERAPGQIVYTDLPWSVPALTTKLKLGDASLQDFLDAPLPVEGPHLLAFWQETLHMMHLSPSRLLTRGTFDTARRHMQKVRPGMRALRFSTPTGYPGVLDAMAGLMFSMECAHAAYISLPVRDMVTDASNYYAELTDGAIIGVVNGRPATPSSWDFDGSDMLLDLAEMPRGMSNHTCLYDQIAAIRSLLHVHQDRFPYNFDALDTALQALRCLTFGAHCPDLLVQVQIAPSELLASRARARALDDALEVMSTNMGDRSKVQTLRQLLVPEAMTMTTFRRLVFSSTDIPFTLEAGKLGRIINALQDLRAKEGPCSPQNIA